MKEFDLIETIKMFQTQSDHIVKGIGDDCAVFENNDKDVWLISTDTLVENVHLKLNEMSFEQIGRKTASVSLSDMASMGGSPKMMLIALSMIETMTEDNIKQFYEGVRSVNHLWNVSLIGGDLVCAKSFSATSTILGTAPKHKVIYRNGACNKDWICVTGFLGGSQTKKHYSFTPRIDEALWLRSHSIPHSMIDISDGLAGDLRQILKESECHGAVLFPKNIPISSNCQSKQKENRLKEALCDGEDFELLFTCSPQKGLLLKNAPFFCSLIGFIDNSVDDLIWRSSDGDKKITDRGYEHNSRKKTTSSPTQ